MLKDSVLNAEQHLQSINTIQGKRVTIAKVKGIKKVGKQDTYNMEVKDVHNFIANGIIVHNSIDSSRYLLEEWKDTGRAPVV